MLHQHHCGCYISGACTDGVVMFVSRGNRGQRQHIWDLLPRATHIRIMMAPKERGFKAIDATTRETGMIAKVAIPGWRPGLVPGLI